MDLDTLTLFKNRLEELGVKTYVCSKVQELLQHLNYLINKDVKTPILIVGSGGTLQKQLIERLRKDYRNTLVVDSASPNPLPEVELSIGFPELALANTGTVIYVASSGIEEASLYFPETHISIISRSKILKDIDDLGESIDDFLGRGESIYLVTGPSSTADIEGEIVRGVHGPRNFYVIVYEGEVE